MVNWQLVRWLLVGLLATGSLVDWQLVHWLTGNWLTGTPAPRERNHHKNTYIWHPTKNAYILPPRLADTT